MIEVVAGAALLLIIAGSLARRAQRKAMLRDEEVRQMLRSTSGRIPPGTVIPYVAFPGHPVPISTPERLVARAYASKSEEKRVKAMTMFAEDEAPRRGRELDPVFIPSFHQDYSMGLDVAKSPDVSPTDFAGFAGGESGGAGAMCFAAAWALWTDR